MLLDKIINKMVSQYETRDPFRIAKELGVKIVYESLGSLNGYYSELFRCKTIHINQDTSENTQKFTCAHELGHALMHEDVNICFLRQNTHFNSNKYENQANEFAVRLVANTEAVENYIERATQEFTEAFGIGSDIARMVARHHIEGKSKTDFSLANTIGRDKLGEWGMLCRQDQVARMKEVCHF